MKFTILFVSIAFLVFGCKEEGSSPSSTKYDNIINEGGVFGTSYRFIYPSPSDFQEEFDSLFNVLNKSLSTYQENSIISQFNRGEEVALDEHFTNVYEASKMIYKQTQGAFDPTIGAVVNAWDFGPEGKIVSLDSLKIDSLMVGVGLDKLKKQGKTIQKESSTYLDFNAIAKGYAVDVIAEFIESKGIENYLVEIGGEIRAQGINIENGNVWQVGIEEPNFDGERSVMKIIPLTNESMATSGTYRKFQVDTEGNRFSHIIDTSTGYPSKTNILSVSVLTETCMYADAYATAFKSMGIEKIQDFLEQHSEVRVYIIFENKLGELDTMSLNGFPE